ncbi:MAG: hypothetical protein KBS68_05300 [Clostridiales bacterium]|nr:hypothetical protein [Candidatus Crickella merdequi]
MVKVLVGNKGTGKTKKMIELANDAVETAKGDIIFINKNTRLIYDLHYKIRVICMDDFVHVTNEDEYIGFIFGILSSNSDIETIYLDGVMRHADIEVEHIPSFVYKIKDISNDYGIDFVMSISAELEDLVNVDFEGIEVLN